jgi:hypothetical protein
MFNQFYHCICCPDPCYEPCWIAVANNAFFVDAARPITQMRVRWDAGLDFTFPDRAEFFWARADGKGKGPNGVDPSRTAIVPGTNPVRTIQTQYPAPYLGETKLRYNELSLYTEGAADKFSLSLEMPYLSVDPDINAHAAGFGDLIIGTKSLLLDCPLMQFSFQFKTFVPTGNFTKGLGTGHVSLEPSLLLALRLTASTYFQAQLSEWIPIGGDPSYEGSILHYHFAVNHILWRPIHDVQLIGSLEFNGYSFQTGQFTDPTLGPWQKAGDDAYLSAGPGLRLVICDRIDFGAAAAFAVNDHHGPEQLYRTEFRWRF